MFALLSVSILNERWSCGFTIVSLLLAITYTVLFLISLAYLYHLYRTQPLSKRRPQKIFLLFIVFQCIGRALYFLLWPMTEIDSQLNPDNGNSASGKGESGGSGSGSGSGSGTTERSCSPSTDNGDNPDPLWLDILGTLPPCLFLTAFTANVFTFARIFHTVLANQRLRFRLVIFLFLIINLSTYALTFWAIAKNNNSNRNDRVQATKGSLFSLSIASFLVALGFCFYAIMLYRGMQQQQTPRAVKVAVANVAGSDGVKGKGKRKWKGGGGKQKQVHQQPQQTLGSKASLAMLGSGDGLLTRGISAPVLSSSSSSSSAIFKPSDQTSSQPFFATLSPHHQHQIQLQQQQLQQLLKVTNSSQLVGRIGSSNAAFNYNNAAAAAGLASPLASLALGTPAAHTATTVHTMLSDTNSAAELNPSNGAGFILETATTTITTTDAPNSDVSSVPLHHQANHFLPTVAPDSPPSPSRSSQSSRSSVHLFFRADRDRDLDNPLPPHLSLHPSGTGGFRGGSRAMSSSVYQAPSSSFSASHPPSSPVSTRASHPLPSSSPLLHGQSPAPSSIRPLPSSSPSSSSPSSSSRDNPMRKLAIVSLICLFCFCMRSILLPLIDALYNGSFDWIMTLLYFVISEIVPMCLMLSIFDPAKQQKRKDAGGNGGGEAGRRERERRREREEWMLEEEKKRLKKDEMRRRQSSLQQQTDAAAAPSGSASDPTAYGRLMGDDSSIPSFLQQQQQTFVPLPSASPPYPGQSTSSYSSHFIHNPITIEVDPHYYTMNGVVMKSPATANRIHPTGLPGSGSTMRGGGRVDERREGGGGGGLFVISSDENHARIRLSSDDDYDEKEDRLESAPTSAPGSDTESDELHDGSERDGSHGTGTRRVIGLGNGVGGGMGGGGVGGGSYTDMFRSNLRHITEEH